MGGGGLVGSMGLPFRPSAIDVHVWSLYCWIPIWMPQSGGKSGFLPQAIGPTTPHMGPANDCAAWRIVSGVMLSGPIWFMNLTSVNALPYVGPANPVYSMSVMPLALA